MIEFLTPVAADRVSVILARCDDHGILGLVTHRPDDEILVFRWSLN